MINELKFDIFAKDALLQGMQKIAQAVGSTLGPKGRCVILDNYSNGLPHVTKDGVTVAKNIFLENKFENVGATLLKQAALNTVRSVGDATTTSTVLAYNMVNNAYKLGLDKNLSKVKKGINIASDFVVKKIKECSTPIDWDDLEKIASISANNDEEIGNFVADAFRKVGLDGVITVEESPNNQTTVDMINGMQFDRGFVSHWFITDRAKGECVLEKPLILITDQKVQLTREILPAAEYCAKNGRPMLIIAQDFDDEVVQNLRLNHLQGNIKCCLVKAPSFGDYRKYVLEDLALLTNAKLATYDNGIELQKVDETMLGSCGKVVITKDSTTILNGIGNAEVIAQRVSEIKTYLSTLQSGEENLQKFHKERIARLVGGICSIKVGANSELEMREKKDRIDDAVCATRAALEEGIVPGGGLTFLKAFVNMPTSDDKDIQIGIDIVKNSLNSVFDKIVENAGENPQEIGQEVYPDDNISWNADTEEYVNFVDAGIFNPAKADRLAFENALGVLNMFISTNCIVTEKDIFNQVN